MSADVINAALVIIRERVMRSVFGVIGAIWLFGTLVLVAAILPLSVDKSDGGVTEMFWGKWSILKIDEKQFEGSEPPEDWPEGLEFPPSLEKQSSQGISGLIANWALAFGGMAFVLIVCCDYFTGAVERGRVELMLARPIPRSVVLLSYYASGVTLVAALFVPVILLTYLVMLVRLGTAPPGYLLTAPILVGCFAVLHAIQTLAGVWSRSWLLALIIPIVLWVACFSLEKVRGAVKSANTGFERASEAARAGGPTAVDKVQAAPMRALFSQAEMPLDITYHVLPKPNEFDTLNTWAIWGEWWVRRDVGEDYSPWVTILSSLAWMVGCLALACLLFHFREF